MPWQAGSPRVRKLRNSGACWTTMKGTADDHDTEQLAVPQHNARAGIGLAAFSLAGDRPGSAGGYSHGSLPPDVGPISGGSGRTRADAECSTRDLPRLRATAY